jgi:hypothetical protein
MTALENAVVVRMDAEICLPEIGFTLTTKAAHTSNEDFRVAAAEAFRVLRRQPWAREARYLGQIEHTTGEGTRAGGARRIHQHGLLKDVARERAADVGEVLKRPWLRMTGAHRVEAHELHRPAGAIAYLVNHHQKSAQTPPRGWSGKRLRPSKGYYERPILEMREEARGRLADDRLKHAVTEALSQSGAWDVLDDEVADAMADALHCAAAANPPELVRTARLPQTFGDDGLPASWAVEVLGLVSDDAA